MKSFKNIFFIVVTISNFQCTSSEDDFLIQAEKIQSGYKNYSLGKEAKEKKYYFRSAKDNTVYSIRNELNSTIIFYPPLWLVLSASVTKHGFYINLQICDEG